MNGRRRIGRCRESCRVSGGSEVAGRKHVLRPAGIAATMLEEEGLTRCSSPPHPLGMRRSPCRARGRRRWGRDPARPDGGTRAVVFCQTPDRFPNRRRPQVVTPGGHQRNAIRCAKVPADRPLHGLVLVRRRPRPADPGGRPGAHRPYGRPQRADAAGLPAIWRMTTDHRHEDEQGAVQAGVDVRCAAAGREVALAAVREDRHLRTSKRAGGVGLDNPTMAELGQIAWRVLTTSGWLLSRTIVDLLARAAGGTASRRRS